MGRFRGRSSRLTALGGSLLLLGAFVALVVTGPVSATTTAIALGSSGPITVGSPGTTQALASGATILVSDGTNSVLATTSAAVPQGSTSIPVQTAAGGAWTAKANVGSTNTVYELTPTDELIDTANIGGTTSGTTGGSTAAFLSYCPRTTIGDIGLPGTTVTGTLSPNPVAGGGSLSITGLAIHVTLPAGLVQAAFALGNTAISGYVSGQLDIAGGTPSSLSVGGPSTAPTTQYGGTGAFSASLPSDSLTNPQPLAISIPLTAGGITAGSSGTVNLSVHSSLTVFDLVNASPLTYLPLTCSPVEQTAVGTSATTGTTTTTTTSTTSTTTTTTTTTPGGGGGGGGAFLSYCPQTNIGDIGLPGTTVSGSLSPNPVSPGGTVNVQNLMINVQIPEGLVAAAEALGNTQIAGYVSGQLDVTGGTPSTLTVGGPATAPTTQYTGTGSFTASLPTPPAAVPINISLTAGTITAGSNTTVNVSVHSSLTVFDLVNASPLSYLPLTCSPVNTTKVGTMAAAIVMGGSGPLSLASPGLSQDVPAQCAVMVTDGTHQGFGTTTGDNPAGSTSVAVTTASGGAWTAKYAIGAGNEVDLLNAVDQPIGHVTVTGGTGSAGTPGGSGSCAGAGTGSGGGGASGGGGGGGSTGSSGSGGTSPATASSTGQLAFTGPNRSLYILGVLGLLLLDLGYLAITAVDRPRKLIARAIGRGGGTSRGGSTGVPQS